MSWLVLGTIASASVIGLYLGYYHYLSARWKERVEDERERIRELVGSDFKKGEGLWGGSARRENSMILMGSIFVVAAFTLLAGASAFQAAKPVVLAAPIIYTTWLLTIQLSTRVMNDVDMEMHLMAENNDGLSGILRRLYGEGHGSTWMIMARRNSWLAYVPILWFAALYVLMT